MELKATSELREPRDEALNIDPRSFHVFQRDSENFLFDRATGTMSVIPVLLFDVLSSIEGGATWPEIEDGLSDSVGVEAISEIKTFIGELYFNGFFRFLPVDHIQQDKMLHRLLRHRPRRIQLLMAQGCNLGCRYCYAWRNGSNQKKTLMSFEVAKRSVDFLVRRSNSRKNLMVTFFGGEPLLNWATILQVVEYCRSIESDIRKKFTFEIITNATLLSDEIIDVLVRERFLVMVSLDGWEEMHNYNRPPIGKGIEYSEILNNARILDRRYRDAGLGGVKVRANLTDKFHDPETVYNYLRNQGFRNIGMSVIEPLPHSKPSPSAVTDQQLNDLEKSSRMNVASILAKLKKGLPLTDYEQFIVSKYRQAPEPRILKGVNCGVGRNTLVVDNNGGLFPCHRYEGMDAYKMGNVFTGYDLVEVLRYYRKVNKNATSRCHSCWIRDYCAGGCAWLLSDENGDLVDPTTSECNRRRRSFEQGLYIRAALSAIKCSE